MGEVLQSLGIGGPKPPVQGPMTTPPIVGGMPAVGTPPDADAGEVIMAPPAEGWKPKKASFLAHLGDAYLVSQGLQPGFVKGRMNKNVKDAMRDFSQDPVAAIRRLNMIPGLQDKAWDMYNQHTDNERAEGTLDRQNRVLDMRNDDYIYNQTAGMMGAANENTWDKMRELALERARARGGNVEALEGIIPKEYDPESVEFIRYGAIKPKDQVRLGQQQEAIDNTKNYRENRLKQFDEQEEGRNNRAAVSEAGKNARSPVGKSGGANPKSRAGKAFKGPNGSLVEYNKDGTGMKVTHPSGKILYFKMGVDGKPVKVGEE
jgi:hypothetical protein